MEKNRGELWEESFPLKNDKTAIMAPMWSQNINHDCPVNPRPTVNPMC